MNTRKSDISIFITICGTKMPYSIRTLGEISFHVYSSRASNLSNQYMECWLYSLQASTYTITQKILTEDRAAIWATALSHGKATQNANWEEKDCTQYT